MQMSFDFNRPVAAHSDANDYHHLPASEKQLRFAHLIAARLRLDIPDSALGDRSELSRWIDAHKDVAGKSSRFDAYPSSKQVAFAEKLARIKRRSVPDECFRDRALMSHWIDSNR